VQLAESVLELSALDQLGLEAERHLELLVALEPGFLVVLVQLQLAAVELFLVQAVARLTEQLLACLDQQRPEAGLLMVFSVQQEVAV
jgi:hypothetical protein